MLGGGKETASDGGKGTASGGEKEMAGDGGKGMVSGGGGGKEQQCLTLRLFLFPRLQCHLHRA